VLAETGGDLIGAHPDTAAGAVDGDATVAADAQHVAHLVGGDPPCRQPALNSPGDHRCGQGGFGGELDLVGHTCGGAPVWVLGPTAGQVKLAINQRVPGPAST